MTLRTAERNALVPTELLELLQRVLGTSLGRDSTGQLVQVKSSVSPRYIRVVNFIRDPEVVKWAEMPARDSIGDVRSKN